MADLCIRGGKPLRGSISVQGSKNAALPMMAASLLHSGVSVLRRCPKITDVFCMEEILRGLGASTWWEDHDLYMDCEKASGTEIPASYTGRMRSSVILLGALLSRNGRGCLGYPGGCVIGKRPIDLHLEALRRLGAGIRETGGVLCASCDRLEGCEIVFPKRSVGATEQGILAAVLAEGETCLKNCAREPEITWLCRYLQKMGADICGEGSDCICIRGVRSLKGGDMQVPPDRIAAGTYICAAAITRSEITLENPPLEEMESFLQVYGKMGGQYRHKSGKLIVDGRGTDFPVPLVVTEVYPGFPTDLQSLLMAVLVTVPGISRIREQIFEERFKAAHQLVRMGARIAVDGKEAVICGGTPLKGCRVEAEELRGGAALILAGLAAQGETEISGYAFVCRGYEQICRDLRSLGADITLYWNRNL